MSKIVRNEIAILFGRDNNNCIIVTFFEAHGTLAAVVTEAGLPVKASGRSAISLTGKIVELCKLHKMTKRSFVAARHTYWAAELPIVAAV